MGMHLAAEKATIGIIGGSGVYDPNLFEDVKKIKIATPYGAPSAPVEVGNFLGKRVAFITRHGHGHTIPPHMVNYRANIWAMKELGVERIISPCAVGSLKEELPPKHFVVPDQYIDFTKKREYTFFDGGRTYHTSLADPYCKTLRETVLTGAKEEGLDVTGTGTYICIEGPRFSTRAESKMFRQFADIIGMTAVPEVQLAREAEICYATIAMVTDYDVWADKPVDAGEVEQTMLANAKNIQRLLKNVIPKIPEKRDCECKDALRFAGL
jgi:5'-methylthioadenosine phosphorylase